MRKILIGSLIANRPTAAYCMGLLIRMTTPIPDVRLQYKHVWGCSDVCLGRNNIANVFLESDNDEIVWIDDDIAFNNTHFDQLISHDVDYVAAPYLRRIQEADPFNVPSWAVHTESMERNGKTGLMLMTGGAGIGFTRMRRKVFEDILKASENGTGEKIPQSPNPVSVKTFHRFFGMDGHEGEDIGFGRKYRQAGGQVWLDPTIQIGHIGEGIFQGDFSKASFLANDDPSRSAFPIGVKPDDNRVRICGDDE
jgi:hypothetical protein